MIYVSTQAQLSELINEGSTSPLMLGGDLVFATNEKEAIDDLDSQDNNEYVVQPRRKAGKGRSKASLYIAIDRESADLSRQCEGAVVVAADQYLAYGLSLRHDVIVLGGGVDADNNMYLEGYVFSDHSLVETFEKSNHFGGMVIDMMLKELLSRYPAHQVHWCDPLPEPPICDLSDDERFQIVETVAVSGTVRRRIFLKKQGVEERWQPLPGIAIASFGAIAFVIAYFVAWSGLERERELYHSEIMGYEESYANSAQSLELLRHREFLLRQDDSGQGIIVTLDNLLGRVSAIERVIIHAVEVFGEADRERPNIQTAVGTGSVGDFIVDLSVPQTDSSARVQGERLVRSLSQSSGLNFEILSHSGNTLRSNEVEREYWRYQLTGSLPDAG